MVGVGWQVGVALDGPGDGVWAGGRAWFGGGGEDLAEAAFAFVAAGGWGSGCFCVFFVLVDYDVPMLSFRGNRARRGWLCALFDPLRHNLHMLGRRRGGAW